LGGLRCIVMPNFIKIGRTTAEISHLTFSKMVAVRHLSFLKLIFWTILRVRRANVRQHAKFRRNRSNHSWHIAIYPFFQDGGRPPFWICGANFGTTHNENLMVFITVQNLVAIALVVLKIQKFEYFARLTWKRIFTPTLGRLFWGKNRGNGQLLNSYPTRNAISRNWRHIK